MAGTLRDVLPPSYHHIVGKVFDRPKVEETRATCDQCSMCNHGDASPVAMEYFHSDTKCCTFWPALPNYLVGAILADEDPAMAEGRRRVQRTIASRIGVTPDHVTRPRKFSLLMSAYSEAFGRTTSLKCPYYDDENPNGNCSIWRHREAVCMTYYCKYSGGKRGFAMWTALRNYVGYVEYALSEGARVAVDPKVVVPRFTRNKLSVEDFEDRAPKESDYAAWWGQWVGREEEYYLRCHDWVQKLTPAEFEKNIDQSETGKRLHLALVESYDLLESKVLPNNLVRNKRMSERHVGDKVVITTYHRYDSFALDKDLFEVVGMFRSDESLERNLERLRLEEGIELTPDLVEFLYYVGVLVEPQKAQDKTAVKPEVAGDLNGRRSAIRAILEARGLGVGSRAQLKLQNASRSDLDRWIKRAVFAKTVDDALRD